MQRYALYGWSWERNRTMIPCVIHLLADSVVPGLAEVMQRFWHLRSATSGQQKPRIVLVLLRSFLYPKEPEAKAYSKEIVTCILKSSRCASRRQRLCIWIACSGNQFNSHIQLDSNIICLLVSIVCARAQMTEWKEWNEAMSIEPCRRIRILREKVRRVYREMLRNLFWWSSDTSHPA